MQSVSAARWLLHLLALLLAFGAMSDQSWDVIDLPARAATSAATALDHADTTKNSSEPAVPPSATGRRHAIERVTFAPGRYCLHRESAVRECHGYAFLLNHLGDSSASLRSRQEQRSRDQVAIHAAALKQRGGEDDERIDRVLSSWCVIQPSGSWFIQGAESMVCLVVLDTCLYTMVFWILFGLLATALSLASSVWPVLAKLESVNAFCSYTTATLGFFLALEWWGYGAYFIDHAYLQSLSLSWRFGGAFQLLSGSVLLSLVAARITLHLAISARANYAQLHAAPPPSPSQMSQPGSGEMATPTASVRSDECRDEDADPLQCPANYHV